MLIELGPRWIPSDFCTLALYSLVIECFLAFPASGVEPTTSLRAPDCFWLGVLGTLGHHSGMGLNKWSPYRKQVQELGKIIIICWHGWLQVHVIRVIQVDTVQVVRSALCYKGHLHHWLDAESKRKKRSKCASSSMTKQLQA